MLHVDQFHNVTTGEPIAGFIIRNRQRKVIAIGAQGGFVTITHKRYANDRDLVAKVAQLSGLTVRN